MCGGNRWRYWASGVPGWMRSGMGRPVGRITATVRNMAPAAATATNLGGLDRGPTGLAGANVNRRLRMRWRF